MLPDDRSPPLALPASSRHELRTHPPFRLDLTVVLLRRLPANPVEVLADGRHVRAFETPDGPVAWSVRQVGDRPVLAVTLHGGAGDPAPWRRLVRRALGLDVDLSRFHARAARLPSLARISRRIEGVRPPRFADLTEAFASVIPFQQVSLASGMAALRRLVLALARPVEVDGAIAWPFPAASTLAAAPDEVFAAAGLSRAKSRALREACAAVASGALREEALEALSTEALVARLVEVPGIGPWSASLIALRGFGRLDVFPPGDATAAKLLAGLGDRQDALARLGPWRGMLYYSLFLGRFLDAGAERHRPVRHDPREGTPLARTSGDGPVTRRRSNRSP